MSRFERWSLGAILWATTCGANLQSQETAAQRATVLISSTAIHQWALLFREFETEYLLCLYGHIQRDTLTVEFTIPADMPPRHSLLGAVAEGARCLNNTVFASDFRLVGLAHNHPRVRAQINGQRFHVDPDEDLCYLSVPDTQSFERSNWPIMIVVCGTDRMLVVLRGNQRSECRYDAELALPVLTCTAKP